MKADEINTLALLIAKSLNEKSTKEELSEILALLCQIMSNLQTYLKIK